MRRTIPTIARTAHSVPAGLRVPVCAWMTVTVAVVGIVQAQAPQGSIVAWGCGPEHDVGQCNVPAPNTGFVAVAARQSHNLGLKADGSIVAWGRNDYGQTSFPSPNMGFIAVAAGGFHSLGLRADGSIVAWGRNAEGQTNVPAPNSGFVAVAAGGAHSLGLRADGSIVAWGANGLGQTNVPAPNSDFIGIAGGWWHSLGLKADGAIVAWRDNTFGQTNVPAPNSGFIAVAAGDTHNLGLKADGSIVAWGDNTIGQTNVPAPNSGFTAIAAGAAHNLGLTVHGAIVAWGDNTFGQTNVPAPNSGFVAVAGGMYHSLAIRVTGACCDTNGADRGCRDNMAQADCINADNTWTWNATCAEVPCQCIPACTGRECGDDGCNGGCGTCDDGLFCDGVETCDANGQCLPGTPLHCDDGLFCNGAESCDPQAGCVAGAPPCDPANEQCDETADLCVLNSIPTVSEWGLVILTLLLLTSAKVAFGRKGRRSSAGRINKGAPHAPGGRAHAAPWSSASHRGTA